MAALYPFMILGCKPKKADPYADRPASSPVAATDAGDGISPAAGAGDAGVSPAASARAELPREDSLVLAGGEADATRTQDGRIKTGIAPFFQMILILGLAALAVYGVAAIFLKARKGPKASRPGPAVLASTPLAPGRFIHVIKAGSKGYLVGSSDHAVSLIAELDDKEYLDALELEAQQAPQGGKNAFETFLRGLLGGRGLRLPGKGGTDQLDFISKQRDRLKGL